MLFEQKRKYLDIIFPGLLEKGLVNFDRKYSCACDVVTWFFCVFFLKHILLFHNNTMTFFPSLKCVVGIL